MVLFYIIWYHPAGAFERHNARRRCCVALRCVALRCVASSIRCTCSSKHIRAQEMPAQAVCAVLCCRVSSRIETTMYCMISMYTQRSYPGPGDDGCCAVLCRASSGGGAILHTAQQIVAQMTLCSAVSLKHKKFYDVKTS